MSRLASIMLSTYVALFLTGFAWVSYKASSTIEPKYEMLVYSFGMLAFGVACLLFANAIVLGTITIIRHGFSIRR